MNLVHSLYEEIYESMDQIVDAGSPLHKIGEAHCHALAESFRNYDYEFVHGTMTASFSFTVNLEDATYETAVYNVDGTKLQKEATAWSCSIRSIDAAMLNC